MPSWRDGLVPWTSMGARERLFATLVVLEGRAGKGVRPRDLMYHPPTDELYGATRGDRPFLFPVTLEGTETAVAIRTLAPTRYASLSDLMEEIDSDD